MPASLGIWTSLVQLQLHLHPLSLASSRRGRRRGLAALGYKEDVICLVGNVQKVIFN